jgi:hypothetical protein
MKRRTIIRNFAIATSSTFLMPSIAFRQASNTNLVDDKTSKKLKGFIVSDAHFGWDNIEQPLPEMQKKMMQRIIKRFSDLDVFIDTGDAHHGALKRETGDNARGNWTDIIAGGCGITPFYYVAGNHEIVGTLYDGDQEWRCNALGSVSCRPYYSFDIKGIHFISLPELVQPIYINKESMEWLALDLEINKDKTVILLSHNNIKGTTTLMGEIGYRGLVNSRELMGLFKLYPNVISWMHGHNHTFEVVEKEGMLYVSNGRIGGFVPPKSWGRTGQGNLGGIYFEISPESLTVRGYSATEEKFFDEMGDKHLSGYLETKTTLEPHAKPSYSFGVGGMGNGQIIPVFNHHLSQASKGELFFKKSDALTINDDPEFSLFELRKVEIGKQWMLMGASVGTPKYFEKENNLFEWRGPGIKLLRQNNPDTFIDVNIPDWRLSKYCYIRGVPGKKYKVTIDLYALSGGQMLELELYCYDNLGNELKKISGPNWILEAEKKIITTVFDIPEFSESDTIYSNNATDKMIQISVKARFTKMNDEIFLNKFALSEDVAERKMINPEVSINGKSFSHHKELKSGDIKHFMVTAPHENRTVIQTKYNGSQGLTWLYRQNSIEWQVRNATVSDRGDYFEIGALRNTWTFLKEIIIVPFIRSSDPFIHRLQNVQKARIYPFKMAEKSIKIEILECNEFGIVILYSNKRPSDIEGSIHWNYENQIATIKVKCNSHVSIIF